MTRTAAILLILALGAGASPAAAQIVPVWRIVTDVSGGICPALAEGDLAGAVARAEALGYRRAPPAHAGPAASPSEGVVTLRGRHAEDLRLAVRGGDAECAVSMGQSTPDSIADAAGPHLAAMGLARRHADDPGVSWSGAGRSARAFPTRTRSGASLVIRFTGAGTGERGS